MLRIKEVIKKKNLSQKEIAEKINITGTALSRMINGNPTIDSLQKLANVLQVDIKEFFQDNENKVSGYIEHKGIIHKVSSIRDLKDLIKDIEQ